MKPKKLFGWLWRSVHLFSVGEVPVQIHTTALVFPWGFLIVSGWMSDRWNGLWFMLAFLLLIQGSILIHEFAHVFAARRFGCETRRVLFIPFGCIAQLECIPPEPEEIWMAGAGPAASAALAVFFYTCALLAGHIGFPDRGFVSLILSVTWITNLGIAVFNLLPCFPMDGGRILRSVLALILRRVRPRRVLQARLTATRIAVRYVARSLALAAIVATILWTHLWHHILLSVLLILAGEAEYLLLRETTPASSSPGELRLLPIDTHTRLNSGRCKPRHRAEWRLAVAQHNVG